MALTAFSYQPLFAENAESKNEQTPAPPLPANIGRYDLGTVVYAGTKTRRALLDSPQSVGVATSEEIFSKGAKDVGDILEDIPGVQINSGPRQVGQSPTIRGLGGRRVQIRQDDSRMNFFSGHQGRLFLNIDDIERIEVLRGSASALYGSDAIGGVINIITKDPSDMLIDNETFGIGTRTLFNSANQEFRQTERIFGTITDYLEYLISYTYWDTGDSIKLSNGDRLRDSEQSGNNLFSKIVFNPSDITKFTISNTLYDEKSIVPVNPSTALSTSNTLTDRTTRRNLLNLELSHAEGYGLFADFKGNFYYQLTEIQHDRSSEGIKDDRDIDTYGLEFKNTSAFELAGIENLLTYGIEYYQDSAEGNRTASGSGSAPLGSFPAGDFESLGVYIQNEITFFDGRLSIIPGVRWDKYRSQASGEDENEEGRFNPKIATVLKVTDEFSLFANYGHGFRSPSLLELYTTGTHFAFNTFVPNPDLRPEKAKSMEAGARLDHDRIQAELVFFYIDAKDFIDLDVDVTFPFGPFGPPGGTTTARNVSDAEIYGLEGFIEIDIWNGISTFATLEITEGFDKDTDVFLNSITPAEVHTGVRYQVPQDTLWNLFCEVEGEFVHDNERIADSSLHTPGYGLWDVRVGCDIPYIKGFKVHAAVENIFNKNYREPLTNFHGIARNFVVGGSCTFKF